MWEMGLLTRLLLWVLYGLTVFWVIWVILAVPKNFLFLANRRTSNISYDNDPKLDSNPHKHPRYQTLSPSPSIVTNPRDHTSIAVYSTQAINLLTDCKTMCSISTWSQKHRD